MKYIFVFIISLFTGAAIAAPHHHSHHWHKPGVIKHGHYYKGYKWNHWSRTHCWLKQYGCYCNYDPYTKVWYYWCVPDKCWYPV